MDRKTVNTNTCSNADALIMLETTKNTAQRQPKGTTKRYGLTFGGRRALHPSIPQWGDLLFESHQS